MTRDFHQLLAPRCTVLIVDDEEALARALARVLRKMGYTVALAAGAEQALELIRDALFDVVLSDLAMPGVDGFELLRRIRELGMGVPVVLMTGDPDAVTTRSASELGAFAVLCKPLDHQELVATIELAFKSGDASR